MKQEAIEALQQFKQMHLATDGQVDGKTESPTKRTINYPKHIKPLHDRIMSAVSNGCRTAQAITTYCGEDRVKVVNMHLGRMLSSGKLVRYTNPMSGITRYYTPDEAKAKGYKPDAQPIKKGKKAKGKKAKPTLELEKDPRQMPLWYDTDKNRSSTFIMPKSLKMADAMLSTANDLATAEQLMQHEKLKKHCTFLEDKVIAWQRESRKQAHEITKLQDALINARKTRDVTSEVTEVMQEVTKLRATVEYLESKLFGRN